MNLQLSKRSINKLNFTFINQGLLKESERRKVDLSSLMETSTGLQTLVEGSEAQLEEKLCGLNEASDRVHTWTEDWLSTVLVSANSNLNFLLFLSVKFVIENRIRLGYL